VPEVPNRVFLVTGAAGFIGSHLVEALLRRGDRVVGIDNFDAYYDPTIKRHNIERASTYPGYVLMEGDIRNEDFLAEVFSSAAFDAIAHLAARAGVRPSISNPVLYEDVNVRGTIALLEAARRHGNPHVVFGSSSSVYGADSKPPFSEDDACDRPCSVYAATKRASELVCYSYHHLYGGQVTCLRFFTVYGPRQRPDMAIHKFTRVIDEGKPVELYGDGRSKRDYTYVDDIVGGVVSALDRPGGFHIYNLGTTALTPLADLVQMISERLGKPARVEYLPDQPGDVPLTHADVTRAKEHLGYRPTTSISDGLDRWVSWYKSGEG
jgi:UDP-glucuronate 4-epimerase